MAKRTDGQIKEFLDRGVDTVYPDRTSLEKRLRSGKPMTVYLGADPSGADLHIGHLVVLQKLRQLQLLGHKVILLLGDFTGQTGDPTDKKSARQPLSKDAVLANAAHYKKQASALLDFNGANPVEVRYNSTWLAKLTFAEVADLAGHFTVQQMLERDMFQERLKANKPISLREFLYPLMQGYDSVEMKVDLEVGATDQTFNMLAGRKLSKEYLKKDKFVLTTPLLVDSSGVKIGKSEGNVIAIAGSPENLYGQVMTLPDEVTVKALEWCTSVPQEEVNAVAKRAKAHPRDAKMHLAHAIVKEVQGEKAASRAQDYFVRVFQKKELPAEIVERRLSDLEPRNVRNLLVDLGLAASTSEAGRLIEQRAVRLDGELHEKAGEVTPAADSIWQVGKKKIVKIAR